MKRSSYAPSLKKDDLDVSLSENQLTNKAASKEEREDEKGDYHRREIVRGELTRTIRLPANVEANNAKAAFADGVLELSLPKSLPAKRQSIKVDSSRIPRARRLGLASAIVLPNRHIGRELSCVRV
jgi:HSP20 family molecular chaperone IbpA